ncbi:MAG: hypothetical protein GEU96_17990 [Propionibacteriales bacterium]|nr:hypothetical protein [Propionibacteriales bacterium]
MPSASSFASSSRFTRSSSGSSLSDSVPAGLQPFAALFGTLALITGLLSLAGNTVLYFNGRATLSDVLWDLASVASFGVGRAFIASGRAVMTGARGLVRRATINALRSRTLSSTARNINKHAGKIATRMGATGGGKAAKALKGRAASPTGWLPRGADLKSMYSPKGIYDDVVNGINRTPTPNPLSGVPDNLRNLPQVQSGVRHAAAATGAANLAGVGGNVADGKTLTDWMNLGTDRTPVER